MKNQNFNYNLSEEEEQNQDEFTIALRTIIPQIEKQLMGDIERQLKDQFDEKYAKAIQQIDRQALAEYEYAIKQLQQSKQLLLKQKQSQILKQISILQQTLASVQQERLIKLQQKFLEQNFQARIMTHPAILQLEREIQEQIFSFLQQKHEATKQRQIKQLIIGHETKQIKMRKDLDLQIKSRIFSSSGLEQLRQQIKQSKTQMGSQKSQFNLKLKKIQTQINQYNEKIKKIEKVGDLEKLRAKYQDLRIQLLQQQNQEQLEQEQTNKIQKKHEQQMKFSFQNKQLNKKYFQHNDDSLDEDQREQVRAEPFQTHITNQKVLKRQKQQLFVPGAQFINNQISLNDQDDEEDSYDQNFIQSLNNQKKINLTAYFKNYLLNSQTAKITESQNFNLVTTQRDQIKKKSLLNLDNVCQLLKQKMSSDPLEKYLNKQSIQKQNNINHQNMNTGQKSSNFAQIYQKHLKKLNKGHVKKKISQKDQLSGRNTIGLSSFARKTIIKNLSQYHKNTFYDKNERPQIINSTENYNTHETNLLSPYI